MDDLLESAVEAYRKGGWGGQVVGLPSAALASGGSGWYCQGAAAGRVSWKQLPAAFMCWPPPASPNLLSRPAALLATARSRASADGNCFAAVAPAGTRDG